MYDIYEIKPYLIMVLSAVGHTLSEANRLGKFSCLMLAACAGFMLYSRYKYRQEWKAAALARLEEREGKNSAINAWKVEK